jgi:hypothetical protein
LNRVQKNFLFGNDFDEEEWFDWLHEEEWSLDILRKSYADSVLVSLRLLATNDNIDNEDAITIYGKYMGKKNMSLNNESSVFPYIEAHYYDSSGETLKSIIRK